ncbi:MAG: enolase C-terminal domain-like protein [Isosphaeraceae bacterium]
MKVGTGPDDVARVRAVREAIGPDVALTIDANGGWDEPTALASLKQLDECGLSIVEQPLPRGNYTGLRRLREVTGCKILADESCFDLEQAEELIAQGCCDALSIYPGKNGGIGRARAIAEYAGSRGIPCTIGSNLEWDVATSAMLHLIVATPNLRIDLHPGDCLGPSYHDGSIARNPLRIEGPFTTLGGGPGLGIHVDWGEVERRRIPG